MNKEEILNYLDSKNIWYEVTNHKAVYTMEELYKENIPYIESTAKNIFVCDDKKRNYYLITIKGDKKIDLKKFRNENNTRSLSFARENDLTNILNLEQGSLTPFGLLNDKELKVEFFIDDYFINDVSVIGVHPNDNTMTVRIKTLDLIEIIKSHGNKVNIVNI